MSLMRLAFWLALLILLLPTDAAQQARLSYFASATRERFTSFCDRNDRTCSTGGDFWSIFLRKAEFGIRLVGDLLGVGGRWAPAPERIPMAPPPPDHRTGRAGPRGTPFEAYPPPWRGGPGRPGGG